MAALVFGSSAKRGGGRESYIQGLLHGRRVMMRAICKRLGRNVGLQSERDISALLLL